MAFTCPRCGMTSQSPADEADGWCGACCAQTGGARPSCAAAGPADGVIEAGGYQVRVVTSPLVPAGQVFLAPGGLPDRFRFTLYGAAGAEVAAALEQLREEERSRYPLMSLSGLSLSASGTLDPGQLALASGGRVPPTADEAAELLGFGERVTAAVAAWPRWRCALTALRARIGSLIIWHRAPAEPECQDDPDDYPWFSPFTWQAAYSESPEPIDLIS